MDHASDVYIFGFYIQELHTTTAWFFDSELSGY